VKPEAIGKADQPAEAIIVDQPDQPEATGTADQPDLPEATGTADQPAEVQGPMPHLRTYPPLAIICDDGEPVITDFVDSPPSAFVPDPEAAVAMMQDDPSDPACVPDPEAAVAMVHDDPGDPGLGVVWVKRAAPRFEIQHQHQCVPEFKDHEDDVEVDPDIPRGEVDPDIPWGEVEDDVEVDPDIPWGEVDPDIEAFEPDSTTASSGTPVADYVRHDLDTWAMEAAAWAEALRARDRDGNSENL